MSGIAVSGRDPSTFIGVEKGRWQMVVVKGQTTEQAVAARDASAPRRFPIH